VSLASPSCRSPYRRFVSVPFEAGLHPLHAELVSQSYRAGLSFYDHGCVLTVQRRGRAETATARLHSLVALLALFAFTWAQDAEAAPPVVSSASERVVTTSVASNFGTASLAVVTAFASEVAAVTASVSEAAGTQSASGVPVSPTAAASVPGTANFVAANASDLTGLCSAFL
jgi:hypothetical protein